MRLILNFYSTLSISVYFHFDAQRECYFLGTAQINFILMTPSGNAQSELCTTSLPEVIIQLKCLKLDSQLLKIVMYKLLCRRLIWSALLYHYSFPHPHRADKNNFHVFACSQCCRSNNQEVNDTGPCCLNFDTARSLTLFGRVSNFYGSGCSGVK